MPSILRFRHALLSPALEPVDDAWIAIEDGIITATGSGRAPGGPVEQHDAVAMPGLVDCHVHLALDGGYDIQAQALAVQRSEAEDLVRANAARHLRSGVTTVRDLGSPGNVVLDLVTSGALSDVGPHILPAAVIGSATGHGSFLATPAETFEDYRAAMEHLALAGATAVKLFASGGVITAGTVPGATQVPADLLAMVVRLAHERGLRVAAHAHGAESIRNAIDAGVDTIEHFSYLADDDVDALRAGGTWLVSTYVATERFVSSPDRGRSNAEALGKIIDHAPHEREALALAIRSGVRIAVGTDAGTTMNPHGGGMQEQAVHLVDAGMPVSVVLRTITVDAATAIGADAGALEPGRPADLIALARTPRSDVRALCEITGVMRGGRWV